MKQKTMFFCLAVILLTIVQLNAQSLKIGPQMGYQKANDADGNYMIGAAARLKLTPSLAVEGAINYRQEKFEDALTVKSWPIMVSGLLYPLPFVYGAVGAGWYNTTFDFDEQGIENKTEQEFGWHFGAGVELPFGKNKLYGDVRYVFMDYNFEDVPFENIDSNFYTIMVGYLIGL